MLSRAIRQAHVPPTTSCHNAARCIAARTRFCGVVRRAGRGHRAGARPPDRRVRARRRGGRGGEREPIRVAQTMRVVLTVMAAPFLVIHFANDGQLREIAQVAVMSWPSLALLAACAAVGGFVISRTPYPNAWFMGPLAACALAGIGGLVEGAVPDILVNISQVVIGCSLGAQFRREFLTKLFRMMLASASSILLVLAVMATAAITCAYAFSLQVAALA